MKDLWSETDGWLEGSRCEHSQIEYIHVCHTSSCSSSWTRYLQSLRSVKNQSSKSVEQLFRPTEKLFKDQTEIAGLSTIDWNQPIWKESSLLCDRGVLIMKFKTRVFFRLGAVLGRHQYWTSSSLDGQNQMVLGDTLSQRIGSNWWRADGTRVQHFPRIHYIGNSCWAISMKDHLPVQKQGHHMRRTRKRRKSKNNFLKSCNICQEVSARMLVISGTWLWENVVRNSCQQAKWWMGQNCWSHRWKRASCISGHQRFRKRRIQKQRWWEEDYSQQRKWRNRWFDSSHGCFCQSALWVRMVNGINKYVTETSKEIPIENVQLFTSTGRPVVKAKPRPKPVVNLSANSCPWKDTDRHWYTTIRSQLCCSAKIHDQNTATWLVNSSRKWWSGKIWPTHGEIKDKVCSYSAMDSQCLGEFCGKRRRRKEENVSILLESSFVR